MRGRVDGAAGNRRSIVKLLVAASVGLAVYWGLAAGVDAQQPCAAGSPAYPACYSATQTAGGGQQAGQPSPTPTNTVATAATPTFTVAPSAPTNTPVPGVAATPAPANSATILGGRGRVANVRATSFTVIWTTDTDMTGQVLFGTAPALGSTAFDVRGQPATAQTHYVDVTGLAPNNNYFFDVQSGGATDNNVGQHYQIKTGPELGAAPSNNAVVGSVLNPGGASPAGGALVWATVRDGNGQGTTGASQLLATLAGPDGRFRLGLQPRVPDLSAYFVYQNAGDLIDLFGKAASGEVNGTVDTKVTQEGGTEPAEARMVLMVVTPTPAATAAGAAATPTPTLVATATPAVASPTVAPAAAPPPTVAPAAAAGPPVVPTAAPPGPAVQLPPLKEMLLARLGFVSEQQAATPGPPPAAAPFGAQPQQGAPGAAQPGSPGTQPGVVPPPGAIPAAPYPAAGQPARPAVPASGLPTGATPIPGGVGLPASSGAVPGSLPTTAGGPATAPQPGLVAPGATPFGVQPLRAPAAPTAPLPVATTPVPTGLAAMPSIVSALFYGGMLLVLFGCGVAVYSLLNGPGWRPR